MPDTTAPVPDLTPTERAIDTMRQQQDAATCPLTGDQWLLFAEVERLLGVIARLVAELDTLRGDNAEYEKCFAPDGRAA